MKYIGKKFYKFKLHTGSDCMSIHEDTFICFHETECYYFCVEDWQYQYLNGLPYPRKEGESDLAFFKRIRVKVRGIKKDGSRIAFDTKQKAYENLKYLKELQIGHLERNLKFIKASLKEMRSVEKYEDLDGNRYNGRNLLTTKDAVQGLVFE